MAKGESIAAIFPASPSKSAEINEKYILDYCIKNNETEWYAWIVEQPSKRTKEDGSPCGITFLEVRKAFVEKFFPSLKAQPKPTENFRTRALAAAAAARAKGKK